MIFHDYLDDINARLGKLSKNRYELREGVFGVYVYDYEIRTTINDKEEIIEFLKQYNISWEEIQNDRK